MKLSIYPLVTIAILITAFIFACQAQDPVQLDTAHLDELREDPLAQKAISSLYKSLDLITYGKVDLEPIGPFIRSKGTFCEALKEDVSHIRGATEYLEINCEYMKAKLALIEKYPELLDGKKRAYVLRLDIPKMSRAEVEQLYEIRTRPDR